MSVARGPLMHRKYLMHRFNLVPARARALAVGALVLLAAACEGGGGGTEPEPCYVRALAVLPVDTAVVLGASYSVLAQPEADCGARVRYSVSSDVAEVDSLSGLVTAKKYGRVDVIVKAENASTTVHLSVVPPGRLAAVYTHPTDGFQDGLVILGTDLSGRQKLATLLVGPESSPAWHPDGSRIQLSYGRPGMPVFKLGQVNMAGTATLVLPELQAVDLKQVLGQYSAAGDWIYFTRQVSYNSEQVWRVHPDGSWPQPVGPVGIKPSPSPDGRYVAYLGVIYLSQDPSNPALRTFFWDTQAGSILSGYLEADGVKFSPSGTEIAYEWQGGIYVRPFPDGPPRRLGVTTEQYAKWVGWSPDGQWLSVQSRTNNQLALIQVSTGLAVPLPNTSTLSQPAWAPATATVPN
jgi:Tol biopolymer transport system component